VVDDVSHLGRGGVGEQADLGRADGLQGQVAPDVLPVVVADGGDGVAAPRAQGDQPHAQRAHLFVGVVPGELAPDAELLLSHGDLPRRLRLRLVEEVLGEGLGCRVHSLVTSEE